MRRNIAIVFLLALAACASSGPRFDGLQKAPSGHALVYVYRVSRFGGAARSPDIFANSAKLGTLRNGGYFAAEAAPGANHIQFGGALGDKSKGLHVDLHAGQTYFMRVDFSLSDFDKHTRPDGSVTNVACDGRGVPFFKMMSSNEEISKLLAATDTRLQKDICTPGVMFVTQQFALDELKETKLSTP